MSKSSPILNSQVDRTLELGRATEARKKLTDVLVIVAHSDEINQETGIDCYSNWFVRALALEGERERVRIHNIADDPEIGDVHERNIIIGGSRHCVDENLAWMEGLRELVRKVAYDGRQKLLGVCFGHQISIDALGGVIGRNPNGVTATVGSYSQTRRGKSDPLYKDIPHEFESSAVHKDVALVVPNGALLLARSRKHPAQSFRLRQNIWTTQFHPEMRPEEELRTLVGFRKERHMKLGVYVDEADFLDHFHGLTNDRVGAHMDRLLQNFLGIEI